MFSLEVLQFEQLLSLVANRAQTPMGRRRLEKLRPANSRLELERDLAAVNETIILAQNDVSWRFSELDDPTETVAVLRIKNAVLDPLSMLELTRLCNQGLLARSVIAPEKNNAPTLWAVVENIPGELFQVLARITKKILPGGEIDDSASTELGRLRREINAQRGRLQKSLESVMRSKSIAIQDEIVTVRNDRYVIPVKSDFSGKISGVAHGTSSSGATVFIEPLEAIEANNELQKLKGKEEREVARILSALTDDLRENLPGIELVTAAVAELDFIKTKVEFARAFDAVVPEISDDETLDLINARHPLLEESIRNASIMEAKDPKTKNQNPKSAIVPVSFKLTKDSPVMIISGANAGGKTVVLKTAGLLSLIAISGLPVPAEKARVPFYKSVLADIGDHQSLSANLSTFSSHISNIAGMIEVCSAPSLILLDEVGTGTDPDEGSALGVALVDHFRRKCGAQVIASTHYRGLKIYAANDPDVINASVEFDEKTLKPTYRLLTGLAGASSGLEIARRFGIIDEVIETARENLSVSAKEAENYLQKLQKETTQATDLRAALEEERDAVATKFASLDIEARQREKARRKEFETELADVLEGFERQSKAFIKTIEDKALKTKLEKERLARKAELGRAVFSRVSEGEARRDIEKVSRGEGETFGEPSTSQFTNRPIAEGVAVLTSLGKVGRVDKLDGDTAEVMVGSMRLRENVSNLKVVAAPPVEQTRAEKLQKQTKDSNLRLDTKDVSSELNLIGQTTAEAEYELDKYLDEAYMESVPKIRIIHGFGTGALKNFVHHFLKNHPHVEKFGFAPQNQGGHGATLVDLK